jgi:nucleoside phosphorylase
VSNQTFHVHDFQATTAVVGNKPVVMIGEGEPHATIDAGPPPIFGIIAALPEEFAAMRVLLDAPTTPRGARNDRADYVFGRLPSRDPDRPHLVVLTLLGQTGTNAAAESCAHLIRSFSSVTTVIMSGIACGVPRIVHSDRHVRLGDVVVATGGIVDYDHVTEGPDSRALRETFPGPSPLLVRRARMLQANEITGKRPWERWLEAAQRTLPDYARPAVHTDVLYAADDANRQIPHPSVKLTGHRPGQPKIHYGRVGSASRSLRNAVVRDEIADAHELLAIEMEGSGISSASFAGGLEWFVVRGVSDYGDERTNRTWRGYASIAAAAYTRALLAECAPLDPRGGHSQQTHT